MGNSETLPHWKDTDSCFSCHCDLGVFTRHHCRNCGNSFCADCTNYQYSVVFYEDKEKKKRVCKDCYEHLSRFHNVQVSKKKMKNLGFKDFELLTIIGTGKYGKVVKARVKATGKIYAVKILDKRNIVDGGEVEHTIAERNILMKIKHPFLMRLHCAFQTAEKLALVMDFVNGGELFYHLQNQPGRRFSNERAKFYAAEICLGIEHLHSMGIIYRDLKPENVLLDNEGHIRLTDFGLSKEGLFKENDRTSTFCGTPEYLAPEVLAGDNYNNAVDWWGFGAIIYEMLTGWAPFYEKDVQKMYQLKISRKIGVPDYVDDKAKHLLIRLLDRNPHTRMTDPKRVRSHPWFAEINWEKLNKKEIEPPYKPVVDSTDSTIMIDTGFTSKNVTDEIGSTTEPGIDDTADPKFADYSYYPPDTGTWTTTRNSILIEPPKAEEVTAADPSFLDYDLCAPETSTWTSRNPILNEAEKAEIYEPSRSQPGSYSSYDAAATILDKWDEIKEDG
eukprot:TRINITY_DN2952_c0_g1_i1.p1 TRINITY_DN2952_c0_g1~~TRINITY_DN2952_c0_g1_i1.p1  ORF type:complete len:502 (-),score=105.55 TRINITY_DN2952_c0_g1_i1:68-1573(-)